LKTITVPTLFHINLNFDLAPPAKRYFAYVLDWLFKLAYILFISLFKNINFDANLNLLLISFVLFSPLIFYTLWQEYFLKGQTLGKKIFGIKVVNSNGIAPSLSQCTIRWIFLLADVYLILLMGFMVTWALAFVIFSPVVGIVTIATNPNQQRLGDMAANTYVTMAKEQEFSIFDTIYAYATQRKQSYDVLYPEVVKLNDRDMTMVKSILEKAESDIDHDLADRLAQHIKKVLQINSNLDDVTFLKKLLFEYNYLTKN
jgi:uncharacterized RDD family membrane protein YckC